jgi:hypothetical protein
MSQRFTLTELYSRALQRQINCDEKAVKKDALRRAARIAKTRLALPREAAAESVRAKNLKVNESDAVIS